MNLKNVNVRVDGIMVIAGLAVSALVYLFIKRKAIVTKAKEIVSEDLNPAHEDNLVNRAAQSIVGEDRLQNFFNHLYAGVDLINPFNKSDDYAREVWGLDEPESHSERSSRRRRGRQAPIKSESQLFAESLGDIPM